MNVLESFADSHAKRLYPESEYILDKIEIEQKILDVFQTIKDREYMTYQDYIDLTYLKIPFLDMLVQYRKIEHNIALDLIKREYVTYENLINIIQHKSLSR